MVLPFCHPSLPLLLHSHPLFPRSFELFYCSPLSLSVFSLFLIPLSSPLVQFNLLHSKFHLCSVPTRALLLSAYIKFINLFPETKATIQEVLRSDSQIRNSDVELQQRAVEYLKLSSIASTDVLVRTGDFETGLLRQF